jgi:hypothetical protein
VTITPAIQKNMNTIAHQAKLGKSESISETIEEMKAMTHAICRVVSTSSSAALYRQCPVQLTIEMVVVARANGSPRMRPKPILRRPPPYSERSILPIPGEDE